MSRTHRSLFLSDLHLGSRRCQAERLLNWLAPVEVEHLYLVGDVVDRWDRTGSDRWPAAHRDVWEELDRRARGGSRLTFVLGNHDGSFPRAWRDRNPELNCKREITHACRDGRRILVTHGDTFDAHLSRRWLGGLGDAAGRLLERTCGLIERGPHPRGVESRLKLLAKSVTGYLQRFERKSLNHARTSGHDGIVCGHVHHPALTERDGLAYMNDGDWVQSCTALTEDEDGTFRLHHAA